MKKVIYTLILSVFYIIPAIYIANLSLVSNMPMIEFTLFFLLSIVFWLVLRSIHRDTGRKKFIIHFVIHTVCVFVVLAFDLFAYYLFAVVELSSEILGEARPYPYYPYIIIGANLVYIGAILCFYKWKNKKE